MSPGSGDTRYVMCAMSTPTMTMMHDVVGAERERERESE